MSRLIKTFLVSFALVGLVWPLNPARAAETNPATASLNQSVDALLEIKDDPTLTETERDSKELEARRKVVIEAIQLSLDEIGELKENLSTNSAAETQLKEIISSFKNYLDEAAAYFNEAETRAGDIADLDAIKDLAAKLKNYRDNVYNPELQKIVDFLLWRQVNGLVVSAETRWQKIEAEIKKFEKYELIDPASFSEAMVEARAYIEEAREITDAVGDSIANPETQPESDQASVSTDAPTNRELLQTALEKLRSSYEIFVQISQDITKILRP